MEAKLKPARQIAAETRADHLRWLMQRAAEPQVQNLLPSQLIQNLLPSQLVQNLPPSQQVHEGAKRNAQRLHRHAPLVLLVLVGALIELL